MSVAMNVGRAGRAWALRVDDRDRATPLEKTESGQGSCVRSGEAAELVLGHQTMCESGFVVEMDVLHPARVLRIPHTRRIVRPSFPKQELPERKPTAANIYSRVPLVDLITLSSRSTQPVSLATCSSPASHLPTSLDPSEPTLSPHWFGHGSLTRCHLGSNTKSRILRPQHH